MVEKPWLSVFIVTCAVGLAVVLDLLQLHVHSVSPCLCSCWGIACDGTCTITFVTNRTIARSSIGGLYVCARGIDIL